MSALQASPSFMNSDMPARCGRRGCGKFVTNGMSCDECSNWFHANCTGLSLDQYESMDNQGSGYRCVSCLYSSDPCSRAATTTSSHVQLTNLEKLVDSVVSLSKRLDALSDEIDKRFLRLQDAVYKVGSSISEKQILLDAAVESVACALPTRKVAEETVKLSEQAIREAAEVLKEKSLRSNRVILWGKFAASSDPVNIATSVFKAVLPDEDPSKIRASWLRTKRGKQFGGILLSLTSCAQPSKLIASKALVRKRFSEIRNISPDLTVEERQLRKVRLRPRNRPLLDAKLLTSPKVVVTPLSARNLDSPSKSSLALTPSIPSQHAIPDPLTSEYCRDNSVSGLDSSFPALTTTSVEADVKCVQAKTRKPIRIIVRLRNDGQGILGDPTLWAMVASQGHQTRKTHGQPGTGRQIRATTPKSATPVQPHLRQKILPCKQKTTMQLPSTKPHNTPKCHKKDFWHGKWKKRANPRQRSVNNPRVSHRRTARPYLTQHFPRPPLPRFRRFRTPYYRMFPDHSDLWSQRLLWRERPSTPLFSQYPTNWP